MPIPVPYVSRSEAETFIHLVNQALKQPGDNPVLLHLYGIGGVGKTTLTRKIEKEFSAKATFLRIALGEKIEDPDTPLEIMETLHDTLPKENAWTRDLLAPKDPFVPLMEQYKTTRHQIETQPPQGSGSVDSAKIGQVKQVLRVGVDLSEWLGLSKPLAEAGRVISDKGVDMVTAGLTLKDEVVQHIQAHQAVQKNRKLKELMLKPVAQLSEAFVQELCQRVKQQPVVLVFDTYEKAPKEVDRWLRRILLDNPQLQQAGVRMIVAGRHRLTTTDEGWRKLQQDYGYLAEQPIERFSPEQTENYMQQAQLEALGTLEDIWAITKGLPYYLNWLREERQQGKSPNLAEGNREIERLLLQGQGDAARQMVYLAACCRWFDRSLIQYLVGQFQLEPPPDSSPDGETDWFDWLIRRTFVVPVATVYRLDDVARDVFRLSCVRNQPELFQQAHDRLARRFKALSDQEVSSRRPVEEKYKNQSWRRYRSEYLYYLIFSRHSNLQQVFRTHLLESRYFEMDALIKDPFRSVLEDVELNEQLAFGTKQFLETIRPAVEYGWTVLEEFSIDYKQLQIDYDLSRDAIDDAIEICLNPIDSLTGLAKLMALLCKAKRCQANDVLKWLKMAATEAETFVDVETSEFCADLFNFQLGLGFYSLGYPEQALAHFDRSIEFNPGKDAAWSNRGNSLDNLGRYQEAIASYDKAIEVKPDKHAAWSNRGISLANLGQHQEAIASYDKAIEFKPNLHEAWYDRGLSLSKLNRYQEAIASYDKAIEVNPDLYKAWYDRGLSLDNLRRYQEAIASYDKAIEFKSDMHEAWNNRGASLHSLGRYQEAIASYDKAIEFKPDKHAAWTNRGLSLANLGRYQEAIASYDKAIEFKPDLHAAWYNRGVSLANLGRYQEAIASYDRAIEFKPDDDAAWTNRGNSLANLGQYQEAIASYDKAIEFKPNLHEAWYDRGLSLSKLNRYQEAIASYDKAIEVNPDLYKAWYDRGLSLHNLRRYQEAIASYDKAIEFKSDMHEAWNNRGASLHSLGRYQEAIASYDKAIEFNPSYTEAYFNKACCYALLSKVEDAIEQLKKAIDLDPKYREQAKTDADFDGIRSDKRFQVLVEDDNT